MKAFVASIALCVLLGTSVITSADLPDRVYRFVELTDEEVARIDLKDTSVDDWLEVVGEPSLWPLDFAVAPGSVHDPSSLDFRMWLAWHDETDRLYVAAEIVDDIHMDYFDPSNEEFLGSTGEPILLFSIDGDQGGGLVSPPRGPDGDYIFGRHVQRYLSLSGCVQRWRQRRMFTNSFFMPWVHLPPFADGGAGSGPDQGKPVGIACLSIEAHPGNPFQVSDRVRLCPLVALKQGFFLLRTCTLSLAAPSENGVFDTVAEDRYRPLPGGHRK